MAATALRKRRVRRIASLRSQGLSSSQIGKRLNLAPSTIRDYERDPFRDKARKRQRRYAVEGVTNPSGEYEVKTMKGTWKSGGPHEGKGRVHNKTRGRQMRALIGYYQGR